MRHASVYVPYKQLGGGDLIKGFEAMNRMPYFEYYFKGAEKRLAYPWDKGLKADEILAYYEETGFKDWTHAETGAPVLKAQHPEFELRNQAMDALMALIADIKKAGQASATDAELDGARLRQRRGQFLLGFIEAENSMGFHAGSEAARVLAKALDHLRVGQIVLRDAIAAAPKPAR